MPRCALVGVLSWITCLAMAMPQALPQDPAWQPSLAAQQAVQRLSEDTLRSHIRFLADDLLEGRGPGSRGDQLAQLYISTELESLGIQPAAADGGWYQSVPLTGVSTLCADQHPFQQGNGKPIA